MSNLDVVHQDAGFIVINKPGGLLSVPGRGSGMQDCAANRVKQWCPECVEHPSVHRLDMDTSGLMIFALTIGSRRHLAQQFEQRLVEKTYLALLDGLVNAQAGEIELAFRLDPDNRPHQVYDPEKGKLGRTKWRQMGHEGPHTRVEFKPLTGRTHQLRLHAAHEKGLGCPIVGDRLYGTGTAPGQLKLHAARLAFEHPETGKRLEFWSDPTF